jgi:hypothetical protein
VSVWDAQTREALGSPDGTVDARSIPAVWEAALAVPFEAPRAWRTAT